jgi:hypothetical protein
VVLPRVSPDERWWGGVVARGVEQPYGEDVHPWRIALGETDYNQANPVLLSTCGRYIWADDPTAVVASMPDGRVALEHAAGAEVDVCMDASPGGLRAAFAAASRAHFPPSGRAPAAALLDSCQYNLWMESNLDRANEPTQAKVLAYAEAVLAHGMPPGVLMIDTNWAEHYGSFRFHLGRFPDPAAMCARLHALGFKVAVWVSPFVSPDSDTFRAARNAGFLVRDAASGAAALAEWWDGFSALVDFTNADAVAWFAAGLDSVRALGVDGFKLDGGDPAFYKEAHQHIAQDIQDIQGVRHVSAPHAQCEAFARFGLRFDIVELRACWKVRGACVCKAKVRALCGGVGADAHGGTRACGSTATHNTHTAHTALHNTHIHARTRRRSLRARTWRSGSRTATTAGTRLAWAPSCRARLPLAPRATRSAFRTWSAAASLPIL